MRLTYSSHTWEPPYDPQGLGDKDIAHPVAGGAEQPKHLAASHNRQQ